MISVTFWEDFGGVEGSMGIMMGNGWGIEGKSYGNGEGVKYLLNSSKCGWVCCTSQPWLGSLDYFHTPGKRFG